jgi:hypothetical protein
MGELGVRDVVWNYCVGFVFMMVTFLCSGLWFLRRRRVGAQDHSGWNDNCRGDLAWDICVRTTYPHNTGHACGTAAHGTMPLDLEGFCCSLKVASPGVQWFRRFAKLYGLSFLAVSVRKV